MRIVVDYESSWRNSFLDGSNSEALPKKGRKFIASMTKLKEEQNFIPRTVSKDTVLGILNRLIGDQRKLYQTRSELKEAPNYFADIESVISFEDDRKVINKETIYIRNMERNTDQNSFTGMIKVDDPIFQSDYSQQFWGVLGLDIESLFNFILENESITNEFALDPVNIIEKLEDIRRQKPIENEGRAKKSSESLMEYFTEYRPVNSKGQIIICSMYCSALYLQLQRLGSHFDMATAKSKMGGISGISKNGFTKKDFMEKYTTGPKKLIYGNPYVREEFVKGEGKIKHLLTKASGQLTIRLDIEVERAIELKTMIDNAGVSAFYLGKKGLAYVSYIDIR